MFCTHTGSSRIGHTGDLKSKDITEVKKWVVFALL